MEVILQLLEKLDSTDTTEESITFWGKEALLNDARRNPQQTGDQQVNKKHQVPAFPFGIAISPLTPPIDRD